ncbi:MAG: phage tail tape measure protein [Thermoguttaceae bacterium]|nr:phage tail tape measure protein [Thermoguttaceae bacterium]
MPSAMAVRAGRAFVELFATHQKLNDDLQKGLNKVQAFAQKAADFAKINIVATISVAYPIARLVDDYAKFDDKMRVVQATTKSTGKDFEDLTELARELGRTTSFTAQQAASGMVALGRSGFKTNNIKTLIGHFLDLSRATATDLPRSIEIASAVLRGFNLDSSQAARVADVLTVAANGSAQTLDDLGEAFKYVAPLARETGMSVEESAKALSFLANMGVKGTMAATAMRNILMRMSQTDVQLKYQELGVDVINRDTGALRSLSDVMLDLANAVKKVPPANRLGVFRELFGLYGLAGGSSLASGIDFNELFSSIDEASGRARDVAQTMDEGIGGKMRLAWSEIKDLFLSIGETITPALEEILAQVDEFTHKFKEFFTENARTLNNFIQVGAGFASGALDVAAFIAKLSTAYAPITRLLIAFQGAKLYVFAFAVALKNVAGAFQSFRAGINSVANIVEKAFLRYNAFSAKTFGGTSLNDQIAQAKYDIDKYKRYMADYQKARAIFQKVAATHAATSAAYATAKADKIAALRALLRARADKKAAQAAMIRIQAQLGLVRALGAAAAIAGAAALVGKIMLGSEVRAQRAVENHTQNVMKEGEILEKRQEQEKEAMNKLVEYSQKQKLNNNEIKESQRLIEMLTNKYGDLGISIDKATGKIEGLTEAQAKLTEKQTQALIQQKRAESMARKSRIEYLKRQYKMLSGESFETTSDKIKATAAKWRDLFSWTGLVESSAERMEALFNEINQLKAEDEIARNEIDELEGKHDAQKDVAEGDLGAKGIVAADAARKLEESMFGAAEASKYSGDVFKDYAKQILDEAAGNTYSRIMALGENPNQADVEAIKQEEKDKANARVRRAAGWYEEQVRRQQQSETMAALQSELVGATNDLARAFQSSDQSAAEEARKTIADATKRIGEESLKAARANAEAAQKAYDLAQAELAKAQQDLENGDSGAIVAAQNQFATAAANLQNANNELTAALEKAGEKIGDPLDRISAIGTFDNLEALDIGGGQNALLEEERRQNRFLERLESIVNKIHYSLTDDYGEMV